MQASIMNLKHGKLETLEAINLFQFPQLYGGHLYEIYIVGTGVFKILFVLIFKFG